MYKIGNFNYQHHLSVGVSITIESSHHARGNNTDYNHGAAAERQCLVILTHNQPTSHSRAPNRPETSRDKSYEAQPSKEHVDDRLRNKGSPIVLTIPFLLDRIMSYY